MSAVVLANANKSGCELCATVATVGLALMLCWQHEWFPLPMSHSPAIFLQHAISASDMAAVGKQASTGAATHRNSKSTNVERRIITKQIVALFLSRRKESDGNYE
jgi:hypothetical protein